MPKASDYAWVTRDWVAACVTVISGATAQDVLTAFGADVSIVLDGPEAVYDDDFDQYTGAVAVTEVLGGVVAVEENGYQGSRPEVLSRLSRLGPTASMQWNVEDDNAFSCARDGDIIATADMYDSEEPDGVNLPDDLMALFVQAGNAGTPTLWATGLAMVEAYTAVAPTREAVTSALPYYAIPSRT